MRKSKNLQKKNKKTVETNIDALNLSKFELEYDDDPLFKKNCAMFDEGRNGGVNFLSSLMLKVRITTLFNRMEMINALLKDDGCQLVLDSDSLYTSTYTRPENLPPCSIPIVYGTSLPAFEKETSKKKHQSRSRGCRDMPDAQGLQLYIVEP